MALKRLDQAPSPKGGATHALEEADQSHANATAKQVLFVCNDFNYFFRQRHHIVERLIAGGHKAIIATPDHPLASTLTDPNITFSPIAVNRRKLSPKSDGALLAGVAKLIKEHQPDAVHLFTIKPVLFGGLGATWYLRFFGEKNVPVVTTFAGLGKAFDTVQNPNAWQRLRRSVRRRLVGGALRHILQNENVFLTFENPADKRYFNRHRFAPAGRSILLNGAGIDLDQFKPAPREKTEATVTFGSSLIKREGIDLFVEAARIIRGRRNDIHFKIAGATDQQGKDGFTPEELAEIRAEEGIELLGEVKQMGRLLAETDIVVLPTRYREGIPRILIEGAASGCALIASNRSGCRAIVKHNSNGILLRRLKSEDLAMAIEKLVDAPAKRAKMGAAGRRFVEENGFSKTAVQDSFLDVYFQKMGSV